MASPPLSNQLDLARLIAEQAGRASPWSPSFKAEDDVWTKNDYMNIPPERQITSREHDVNRTCSSLFGPMSGGGLWGGCVAYTPDDAQGLYSTMYVPKRYNSRIEGHESLHAKGWLHPWPGFYKQWGSQ